MSMAAILASLSEDLKNPKKALEKLGKASQKVIDTLKKQDENC